MQELDGWIASAVFKLADLSLSNAGVFTLPQLQNLYESILEVKFDRRNFANKMKHYEILTEVEDDTPRNGTRTPVKYKFDKENYDRLKSNGFQLEF